MLVGRHLQGHAEVNDERLRTVDVDERVLEGHVGVADSLGVYVLRRGGCWRVENTVGRRSD